MRKRLGKLGWWLPVINAIVVGLALWLANDLNWRAVLTDEALIALFVLAYTVIILRLPIGDSDTSVTSAQPDEPDEVTQVTMIADPNNPPETPRPFLGHRYPAGAQTKRDKR